MNLKLFVICLGAFALGFALMYFNQQLLFFLGMVALALLGLNSGPRLEHDPAEEKFKKDRLRFIRLMWISAFYVSSGFIALFTLGA
ncbi:hypothetical protein BKP56_12000 [Marinilactibacillus sp. 15R]|uniref:Uncharacterized protein n=1 Tax=Marinilactibacillus piezotolerans TaxID=258723 RepID=A0A1I3WQG2_9LACT|nr:MULTISPECIES: hypothetical protein [Marinilactibacillus]API89939.1 hypothetical protein BKP56_12000 [Marinilactibacillus sp. 15R]SFK09423.1 hypothetical protein SAMN04488569_100945 [Marinilactibacillus piezotolerans]